jgi:phenylacetate-CoA ligase
MRLTPSFIRSVLYPLNELREGKHVLRHLERLRATQWMPPGRLADLQAEKLRRLVGHAYRNSPFYRRRFADAGLRPRDVQAPDDLRKLPVLTKDDLRRHLGELVARNVPPGRLHRVATGGSTGEYTPFYRDNACLEPKRALEFRFNRWAGWDVGEGVAQVWVALQDFARPVSWRGRLLNWLLDRHLMVNAGMLDEPSLARHCEQLCAFAPAVIRAFPNPLSVLARYLRDSGAPRPRPRGILSVGEPLLSSQRRLFEEVFGCPVFNCYVSRECGNIACECELHAGLHVNAESLVVEFDRDGRPARPGEPGDLLVTDLDNHGMPFLRYRIGDLGAPAAAACPCGRTLPLMSMDAGRVTDFLVSPHDGSLVSGASFCHYLIAEGPEVGKVQIVQDARDHLTIRIVRAEAFRPENLAHFEAVVTRVFRGRMRVDFAFVESIPRERSGKYRFCVNQGVS